MANAITPDDLIRPTIVEVDWLKPGLYEISFAPEAYPFNDEGNVNNLVALNEVGENNSFGRLILQDQTEYLVFVFENKIYNLDFEYDQHFSEAIKVIYKNKICFLNCFDIEFNQENVRFKEIE